MMHAQGTPLTHVRINPIDINTENWDAFVEASVIILYTTPLLPPPPSLLPLPNNQHDPPLQPSPYSTPSRVFFWFTTPSFHPSLSRDTQPSDSLCPLTLLGGARVYQRRLFDRIQHGILVPV